MKAVKRKPKVWEFAGVAGVGVALGAVIAVVATNESKAWELARKWCVENHLNPDTLFLAQSKPFSSPMVVYGWDGDY